MKKLIGLIIFSVLVGSLYVRYQAIQFGKQSYLMGCDDASLKLELSGKLAESVIIGKFCKARERALDSHLGFF